VVAVVEDQIMAAVVVAAALLIQIPWQAQQQFQSL
jgi:uncharacterized membrane protein